MWNTKLYLGGLTSNLGLPKFQGRKTSSQSRYMYNKGKITPSFSYILIYEHMGHNVETKFIIGYSDIVNNQTISIYIYTIWKQYVQDFLSCRIKDEVSADAAADAAADTAYVKTTKLLYPPSTFIQWIQLGSIWTLFKTVRNWPKVKLGFKLDSLNIDCSKSL